MQFENKVTMCQQLPEELVDQPQEDVTRPSVGTTETILSGWPFCSTPFEKHRAAFLMGKAFGSLV